MYLEKYSDDVDSTGLDQNIYEIKPNLLLLVARR